MLRSARAVLNSNRSSDCSTRSLSRKIGLRHVGACIAGAGLIAASLGACSPSTGNQPGDNGGSGNPGGGSAGFGGDGAGGGANPNDGGSGNLGTGGSGFVFKDSGSQMGAGGKDGGCGGQIYAGEIVPLDIYIMFDQSASMSCSIASGTRWDAVKTALTSFVQNQGAATINVGLGYFGTAASPPGSSCLPTDYKPDVEIGPLSTTGPAIVASLNAHNPLTDTPTLPALQSAITHAIEWKARNPGHTVVVVLVTDGQPNACGANTVAQIVSVADSGFANGTIPTYVIGILSPGSTCALDPNQPNPTDLDSVAKAGGTDKALIVDTTNAQQDAGAQFLATMNNIRQNAQIPCEYAIPLDKTTNKPPDANLVNLSVLDPTKNSSDLYFVDTKDKCDPSTGGWYFDVSQSVPDGQVPPAPSKIILCGSTCSAVTGTFGYAVSINLGCKRRPPPH